MHILHYPSSFHIHCICAVVNFFLLTKYTYSYLVIYTHLRSAIWPFGRRQTKIVYIPSSQSGPDPVIRLFASPPCRSMSLYSFKICQILNSSLATRLDGFCRIKTATRLPYTWHSNDICALHILRASKQTMAMWQQQRGQWGDILMAI